MVAARVVAVEGGGARTPKALWITDGSGKRGKVNSQTSGVSLQHRLLSVAVQLFQMGVCKETPGYFKGPRRFGEATPQKARVWFVY